MSDSMDISDIQKNMFLKLKQLKVAMNGIEICGLCMTQECQQSNTHSDHQTIDSAVIPYKETIGNLEIIPNELIAMILKNLTIVELSVLSTVNKWFRDFILQNFIETKTGLKSLLGDNCLAANAITEVQRKARLSVFSELGLLLKRLTCLYPTETRIGIIVDMFSKLDGFPKITSNPMENMNIKLIFESYGRVINQLIAGWDDSELKHVFNAFKEVTKIGQLLTVVLNDKPGSRQSIEYYIRSYYRMFCNLVSDDNSKSMSDNIYWIKRFVKHLNIERRARLLMIIFGPLISTTPKPTTLPYIGYWDLTDTFFIHTGLEQLGYALYLLYETTKSEPNHSSEQIQNVVLLFDAIIELPTNWLLENIGSLLFYSGEQITYDYLFSKVEAGDYTGAAQKIVFLCLVSHKLTKSTRNVYFLIEKLATTEHKDSLYNEITVAFSEAVTDIENAFELEDDREVTEVHEMIEANNDLLKNFMVRPEPNNSQQSSSEESKSQDCSNSSKTSPKSEE